MFYDRFNHIAAACRLEPTGGSKERAERPLIDPDYPDQDRRRRPLDGTAGASDHGDDFAT